VRPTIAVIATNFLNLPFADEIMDAFEEYSNEYEFTSEGVFRRINSPACLRCGKRMSHNGYNTYPRLELAVIKPGKYHCKKCNISSQAENIFLTNMKFEISKMLAGLYQVLRNHEVSYEGVSEVMDYLIPQSRDTFSQKFLQLGRQRSVARNFVNSDSPLR